MDLCQKKSFSTCHVLMIDLHVVFMPYLSSRQSQSLNFQILLFVWIMGICPSPSSSSSTASSDSSTSAKAWIVHGIVAAVVIAAAGGYMRLLDVI